MPLPLTDPKPIKMDEGLFDRLANHDFAGVAQYALAGMMAAISEDLWYAGWLNGLERILWNVVQGDTRIDAVSERQVQLLKLLSEEAEGWIAWEDGVVFVPMSQWLDRVSPKPDQKEA